MLMPPLPWIQSLLLLSPRRPFGLDQYVTEAKRRFAGDESVKTENIVEDSQDTGRLAPPLPSYMPSVHTNSTTSMMQSRQGGQIAEIVNNQGSFWPISMQPARTLLEMLGNGVVVSTFPASVSFLLHGIICGEGNVNFSWLIEGPYNQSTNTDVVLASPVSKSVLWMELATFAPLTTATPLRVAIIKESVTPIFAQEGVYFLTAKLNGIEAGRIPLSVTSL